MDKEKIANITIQIPYHGSGNVITQKTLTLDIFKEDNYFTAIPLLELEERRIANLPPELLFEYKDGKIVSRKGIKEGNLHVLQAIADVLKKGNLLQ